MYNDKNYFAISSSLKNLRFWNSLDSKISDTDMFEFINSLNWSLISILLLVSIILYKYNKTSFVLILFKKIISAFVN